MDGLRAIAVCSVILFHLGLGVFSGGYVGVDIFFVISGYLITTIIITDQEAGRFSLLGFYERRMRRILPALFFVLGASALAAWVLLRPTEMRDFSSSLASATASVSNIYFRKTSGYFDPSGELRPLLHTWSLGVEEQFYLLFPAFLLLLWKRGYTTIIAAIALLGIGSLVAAQVRITDHPVSTFFYLQTRGWELILGSLLAFFLTRKKRLPLPSTVMNLGAICGLAMILYAVSRFDQETSVPGLWALVPTLGAALIIMCANQDTLVGRFLSTRILVWVGLISYSLYLWHQPLLAFTRIRYGSELPSHILASVIAATLFLSVLSWRFIETPFRRPRLSARATFVASGSAAVVLLAFGLAGRNTDGFESYYYANRLSEPQKAIYSLVKSHTKGDLRSEMGDDGACNFWSGHPNSLSHSRFRACAEQHGKAVLVLGDSHGMNLYNALYRAKYSKFLIGLVQPGCRPHRNLARCQYDDLPAFVKENRLNISKVLFHQSGSPLMNPTTAFSIREDNIRITTDYLNGLSQLIDVVWIGPQPEARVDFRNIDDLVFNGLKIGEHAIRTFVTLDLEIHKILKHQKIRFQYFSLVDALKIDPSFLLVGNCFTYRDGDHFSVCGEKIVGERLKPLLSKDSISRAE
nr:acyltransferase family protein [Pseudorhodoplanes sinuspersici]